LGYLLFLLPNMMMMDERAAPLLAGDVTSVDTRVLKELVASGHIPVVATVVGLGRKCGQNIK
jgi:acetylglutamate kinase